MICTPRRRRREKAMFKSFFIASSSLKSGHGWWKRRTWWKQTRARKPKRTNIRSPSTTVATYHNHVNRCSRIVVGGGCHGAIVNRIRSFIVMQMCILTADKEIKMQMTRKEESRLTSTKSTLYFTKRGSKR